MTQHPTPNTHYRLSGSVPAEVHLPGSESECAEIVLRAVERNQALVPWGGGTSIQQGNRIRASNWAALSTDRLVGEIDFSPADMVVTAPAGARLANLQATVGQANQFLPIDHPFPEQATVGGIIAANAQGLWREAFGLPRDRLLGVRVVLADGSRVKSGGKVVKNVAGYDLNKLFAGSWGTLGVITEATFKTNPMPESTLHLNFTADSLIVAARAGLAVHQARLQPLYLVMTNGESAVLSVGLMGSSETTAWQADQISAILGQQGMQLSASEPTADTLRIQMEESNRLRVRYSIRPTDLPDLLSRLVSYEGRLLIRAQLSVGVIDVLLPESNPNAAIVGPLQQICPAGGHLVWTNVPDVWRPYVSDVWGPTRGDFHLMRDMKNTLDPKAIFSPGRFIGGI